MSSNGDDFLSSENIRNYFRQTVVSDNDSSSEDEFVEMDLDFEEMQEVNIDNEEDGMDIKDEDESSSTSGATPDDTEMPVFDWKNDTRFNPDIHPFTGVARIVPEIAIDASELDYFKIFVNSKIMDILVKETNRYYKFTTENSNAALSDRLKRWVDTNVNEMYIFLALCLLMSRNSRNVIIDHWSTLPILFSPIYSATMPRNRFQILLRMLSFCDHKNQVPDDRLYKIRPILDEMRSTFKRSLTPGQSLCIGESLLVFKGSLLFKECISSKAQDFGIKTFVLCDCQSGYVLDLIFYTGATTEIRQFDNFGKSGNVVMTLLSPYLGNGHTLYVDKRYTSPALFKCLHELKTNACGTVNKNRKGMPKFNQKLNTGDAISFHTDTTMAQMWKDKKCVTLLSTIHTPEFKAAGKCHYSTEVPVLKPACLVDYNKHLGAVDRNVLSNVKCFKKCIKWYKKLFFQLVDISLFNAYAIYKSNTKANVSYGKFQLRVISQLLEVHNVKKRRDPPRIVKISLDRIVTGGHYLGIHSKNGHSRLRRCVVCSKNKVRKESRYYCKKCDVGLCVVPCYEIYHTMENY